MYISAGSVGGIEDLFFTLMFGIKLCLTECFAVSKNHLVIAHNFLKKKKKKRVKPVLSRHSKKDPKICFQDGHIKGILECSRGLALGYHLS